MENVLQAKLEDILEQYEEQLNALQKAYGEAMMEIRARKNRTIFRTGRTKFASLDVAGLREDGFTVPLTKLCLCFDVSRRTVYQTLVNARLRVQERFANPIK